MDPDSDPDLDLDPAIFAKAPLHCTLLFQVKSRVKRQGLWGGSQQWRMPQQSHRPQARASQILMPRISSRKGIVSRDGFGF
jgi:hypothetical protein